MIYSLSYFNPDYHNTEKSNVCIANVKFRLNPDIHCIFVNRNDINPQRTLRCLFFCVRRQRFGLLFRLRLLRFRL